LYRDRRRDVKESRGEKKEWSERGGRRRWRRGSRRIGIKVS
jgi:hypothetical protein